METKASAKYIRISSRKARLVVDLIRGRDVADAQQILEYSPKAAARVVSKVLNSAIANAEHNNGLDPDELYVSRAFVDEGPTLKRFRPRAMGRATHINKRTSHITLVLDEREPRGEAKRRRFRRPARKKTATEPEVLEGELEEEELEEEELEEAAAAAPEAPRDEDEQEELDAEVEVTETVEAEAEEAPKPAKKASRKTAKPRKTKKTAAEDQAEPEADVEADDSGSEE